MIDSNTLQYNFVAIKLKEEDPLAIGYIKKKNHVLSEFGELYVKEIESYNTMRN